MTDIIQGTDIQGSTETTSSAAPLGAQIGAPGASGAPGAPVGTPLAAPRVASLAAPHVASLVAPHVAPLVAPPQFSEPALTKPRPSAQQVATLSSGPRARAAQSLVSHALQTQEIAALMPAPSCAPSLRTRVAAFAVMKQCLRVQSAAPERSLIARVFGREPLHPDARSWYRGAIGELEVARILSKLDRRWTVLHAVPVGGAGADIDHVLIGPAGTFTINTKNHSGKKIWTAGSAFMVNGQKLAHIHNSAFEAKRAARLLSDVAGTPVAVTPLIVVVRPDSLTRKKPDVTVIESAELFRWLARQPQMQTDATVARIVWAAERRETWTTLVDELEDAAPTASGRADDRPRQSQRSLQQPAAADYETQFARLRSEVETAESRRQAWSLLGAAAFLGGVIASAMLIAPAVPAILSELMGGA